jgi:magnesium-transporting ATPase (P-type)
MPAKHSHYYHSSEYAPTQLISPGVASKKELVETTILLDKPFELNRNPFKWSKRIGALLVVNNFFFIVYVVLMIIVATLVLELQTETISVAQQQSYHFPVFNRVIEVCSIVCAAVLTVVLSIGITSNLSECISPGKQLILSWIHFTNLILFGSGLMVLSVYYFILFHDSFISVFFLTIYGVFLGTSFITALLRIVVLTKELNARKIELKFERSVA